MTPFFRRIRRKLANDNQFLKYMRYAIGEIVLVVIGILIALQMNIWNEDRKQDKKFEGLLEQIYKSIYVDGEYLKQNRVKLIEQVFIIDELLENDSIEIAPNKLVHILFYLDLSPENLTSDTKRLIQFLNYDSNNKKTLLLTKELATYKETSLESSIQSFISGDAESITQQLMKLNIPKPPLAFGLSSLNNFERFDGNLMFFDNKEIQKATNIVKTKGFRTALKTLKSWKIQKLEGIGNGLDHVNSYLKIIKNNYPNILLQYNNIGILGTALEVGFEKSIPMQLIDPANAIWEIDIFLNNGTVKFRDLNNWQHNWGGKNFPNGETEYYGDNISVQKGNYLVRLNLTENAYEFIKRDD